MKIFKFLVKAKKSTYASNGELGEKKLPDGTKELTYSEKDMFYRDRYTGFNPFSGQEIVFDNKKAIWSMNYYGKCFSLIMSKKIYSFLKKALFQVNEKHPFRGPKMFKEGNWKYINNVNGDIKDFDGREEIYYKGKKIYELKYHGGKLK